MSGELGLAGYLFQYHVILLTALDLWAGPSPATASALIVEGSVGAEKIDFELRGANDDDQIVVQVKSRWNSRAWSPKQVISLLAALNADTTNPDARLELVTNGRLSPRSHQLHELLTSAEPLTDGTLAAGLRGLGLSPTPALVNLLRRSRITVRPVTLPELRDQVRDRLRQARATSGTPVSMHAADLLRGYLLDIAMRKTDTTDLAGRTLTRDEFLDALGTPETAVEAALHSRWGVPVAMSDRAHSTRRDTLLAEVDGHLRDRHGVHATDGRVRTVVLAGPAGAGKTTTAQHYALEHAAEFDWIYQLTADADDQSSGQDVLRHEVERLAQWLIDRGLLTLSGPWAATADLARAVTTALASCTRSWLLIVDNATTADTIARLLPASGYGVVVITTRNSGWHGPHPIVPVGALTEQQSQGLIRRRLGTHVRASDDDLATLCHELEHLPLSLVTAAGFLLSTREPIPIFLASLRDEVRRLEAMDFPLLRLHDYPRTAVAAVRLSLSAVAGRHPADLDSAMTVLRRASLVFPDRIPTTLLATDRDNLNRAVAVLSELSLISRWQDEQQHDWARVHRIIQDVVRAELDAEPTMRTRLLGELELATTDLLADSMEQFDIAQCHALRRHADTLAEWLRRHDLLRWQTTTALLSNVAQVARLQGDLTASEHAVRHALELIPPHDSDPQMAARRGLTLLSLADLLLQTHQLDAAHDAVTAALQAHAHHQTNAGHHEAMLCCQARLAQIDAARTMDNDTVRSLFEQVQALPEPTPHVATAKAEAMVRIGRHVDALAQHRPQLQQAAEHLLALAADANGPRRLPLGVASAHLCLVEVHCADGGVDAAARHYAEAMSVFDTARDIDPALAIHEVLDLAVGLIGSAIDHSTELPREDTREFVAAVLQDVTARLGRLEDDVTPRPYLEVWLRGVQAVLAALHGDFETYKKRAGQAVKMMNARIIDVPANVANLVRFLPSLEYRALLTGVRVKGPRVGVHVVIGGRDMAERPRPTPTPCRHFDSEVATSTQPDGATGSRGTERTDADGTLDRRHAADIHLHLLNLYNDSRSDMHAVDAAARVISDDEGLFFTHLVGASVIVDSVCSVLTDRFGLGVERVFASVRSDQARWRRTTDPEITSAWTALSVLRDNDPAAIEQFLAQQDPTSRHANLVTVLSIEHALAARLARERQDKSEEGTHSLWDIKPNADIPCRPNHRQNSLRGWLSRLSRRSTVE